MINNQEMYCAHCKKTTLFFLESDLLWYCDECGKPAESQPYDENEEDFDSLGENDAEETIRCPFCHHLVSAASLEDGGICPVCYEDLSGEPEKKEYDLEGEIWD